MIFFAYTIRKFFSASKFVIDHNTVINIDIIIIIREK